MAGGSQDKALVRVNKSLAIKLPWLLRCVTHGCPSKSRDRYRAKESDFEMRPSPGGHFCQANAIFYGMPMRHKRQLWYSVSNA